MPSRLPATARIVVARVAGAHSPGRAGVRASARSNANGVAFLTVNPTNAGLLTVTVLEARRPICGPKRIGVVQLFTAPLTG